MWIAAAAAVSPAHAGEDRGVFFVRPVEGAVVGRTVEVIMGVRGMTVEPAGERHAGAGHHHLIIDGGPVTAGEVVPKDARHLHFGKGQRRAVIELAPGPHTLTLQFADGHHRSYGRAWSRTIRIEVR